MSRDPASRAARAVRPWLTVLLLVVMAGTAGTNAAGGPSTLAPALALAGLACLAVLVPARHPAPPLLLVAAAVGCYLVVGLAPGPIFLTVPLTTLVVALGRDVRTWAPWAGLALLAIGVGGVTGAWRGGTGAAETLWPWLAMVALVIGAGAVAGVVGVRAEARAERAERAVAEERLRMAQDLHDGVGHGLAVVAMQAGVALHVLDRDPVAARASLEAIRGASREALERLREEVARLSGDVADTHHGRPEPGLADLPELVDRVRGGGLEVELRPGPAGADVVAGATAYRVVQEALTNVLRHADARRVRVVVRAVGEDLEVEVVDDGRGPDGGRDGGPGRHGGRGLAGMSTRVRELGGTLETGPGADGGFSVVARLPLDETARR